MSIGGSQPSPFCRRKDLFLSLPISRGKIKIAEMASHCLNPTLVVSYWRKWLLQLHGAISKSKCQWTYKDGDKLAPPYCVFTSFTVVCCEGVSLLSKFFNIVVRCFAKKAIL